MEGTKTSKKTKTTKKKYVIWIALACVLALLLGIFLSLPMMMSGTTIAHNVYAQGISLGGMTPAAAAEEIRTADVFRDVTLTLKCGGFTREVSAEEISLTADPAATAEKAINLCKEGNIFSRSVTALALLFGEKDIGIVCTADNGVLDEILYSLGAKINGELVEHQVMLDGDSATIIPGTAGQSRDVTATREMVLAAASLGNFDSIAVTLAKTDPEQLTEESAYALIHKEPKEAEYIYEGNTVTVTQSVVGCDVDKALLADVAAKINAGSSSTIPVTVTEPANTTEFLESKLFSATLASYSTTFSTAAANRADNVALAASKINDTILAPGEVFSYAEVLGNPSLANGFKVAPVYENGKTSQGVGGGVCQVSSTLYSAVLYADLEVVTRQNHSLTVAYVPKGQDATFAYGAIDFKFKNNTGYPVKISAGTNGGRLTVSIIGAKRDVERTVQLSHRTVSTTEPTVKETKDPTLPVGTKQVTSAGKTGYVVETTKTVYENGKEVSSKMITRSTYRMVPTEVTVGTKEEAAPTVADPAIAPTTESVPAVTQTPAPAVQTPAPETAVKPTPNPEVTE